MPIMMMLIMPWAANQEIKDINLCIVDNSHSPYSQRLLHKAVASGYFHLSYVAASNGEALQSVERGESDIILEIAPDFEKDIVRGGTASVMISANAVNGTKGGLSSAYLTAILSDFASDLRSEQTPASGKAILPVIQIVPRYTFNPSLDYKVFILPALMVMLLTVLSGFLPALNIVSEKEIGTIEQLNVSPVNKFTFILAKLIPFWIIGYIVLTICFGIAALVYGLFPEGSLLTIYILTGVYILVVSGLGLVISNYSNTLQQAMFVMFFFIMILILISGLFTPINSMPGWAQMIAMFNPLKYFIQVMRMIYLKGSGIAELPGQLAALCAFAIFFNLWAVFSYRKSK
jgi:ABC-2 type transport system permease protein